MKPLLTIAALVAQAPSPNPIILRCFYDDGKN